MAVLKIWDGDQWLEISAGPNDHGALAGLADDDHTQYPRSDGGRGFAATVSGVDPVADNDLSTKNYVDITSDAVAAQIPDLVAVAVLDFPSASENFTMLKVDELVVVEKIFAVLRGTNDPSVHWSIRHAASRDDEGAEVIEFGTTTAGTSGGDTLTVFDNPTISGGSWIWLATSGTIGGVTEELTVQMFA